MIRALTILALALPAPDRAVTLAGGANQPQLAASEDGSFYAVFIKDGNIECAVSENKGKTWSRPAVAIDAKGKAKGGMQRGPRIAVDGRKTIYITAPLCFDEAEFWWHLLDRHHRNVHGDPRVQPNGAGRSMR